MPADFQQKQARGRRHRRDALGRFPQGQSGNPAGRALGSRNAATELAETLLDGEAEGLVRKCVELVLAGDKTALKLCIERLVPRRARTARLDMPEIATPADTAPAMAAIARAAAAGTITPDDGAELARIVESCVRTLEIADFERRLKELEDERAART
jgi:hypothetical protein